MSMVHQLKLKLQGFLNSPEIDQYFTAASDLWESTDQVTEVAAKLAWLYSC